MGTLYIIMLSWKRIAFFSMILEDSEKTYYDFLVTIPDKDKGEKYV